MGAARGSALPAARWLRVTGGLAAVALLAWALAARRFRADDGFPESAIVLPLAAGAALLLVSIAGATAFRAAASWMALLLVGQAAALRLVDAGTRLHYQHYVRWSELLRTDALAVAILAAQSAFVAIALARRGSALVSWRRGAMRGWQAALLAILIALLGAALSEDPRAWLGEVALSTLVQAIGIGTIVLAAVALPRAALEPLASRVDRLLGSRADAGAGRPRTEPFAWWAAAWVLLVTATLSWFVYERHPHVQDEVKYLYQARYFAAGALAMPAPPVPAAFEMFLMEVGPRGWFSVVPPGWPAVLALGVPLGAAWLVNPLLAAASIPLLHPVTWRLYDRRTARLVTLLVCASPWYLFLGMSFMAHPLTLVLLLLAVRAVMRAREDGGWWWTWFGGLAIGIMSLVRQLDALVVALLLGLWAIGVGGKRLRPAAVAGLVLGTALGAAITLPYNAFFTGAGGTFPMMAHTDRLFGANSNAYGFGADRGMGWELDPFPGHGPLDALVNSALNASAMHVELFGWATGSLVLAAFVVITGRARDTDRLALALILAILAAYSANYFSGGPDFGARYWYLMLVPAAWLTAGGVRALAATLPGADARANEARVTAGVLALGVAALVVFVPWRATDKYRHYLGMRPDARVLAASWGSSLVVIRGKEHPDYTSAAIYNPLDVRAGAPVFARDRDAATRAALLAAYADRPVYIVDGPTRTGGAYRVVAGPLRAEDAARALERP